MKFGRYSLSNTLTPKLAHLWGCLSRDDHARPQPRAVPASARKHLPWSPSGAEGNGAHLSEGISHVLDGISHTTDGVWDALIGSGQDLLDQQGVFGFLLPESLVHSTEQCSTYHTEFPYWIWDFKHKHQRDTGQQGRRQPWGGVTLSTGQGEW